MDEVEGNFDGLQGGRGVRNLRADVDVRAPEGNGGKFGRAADGREGFVPREAELAPSPSGLDVVVGVRLDARVEAQGDGRQLAARGRQRVEPGELVGGLDVEPAHARFEGVRQLGLGLADAGEDDARRVRADGEDAIQLAAGDDVEARALGFQLGQQGQVEIGFNGEADERAQRGEGRGQAAVVFADNRGRIDVERRAIFPREARQGDRDAMQLGVEVSEAGHAAAEWLWAATWIRRRGW